ALAIVALSRSVPFGPLRELVIGSGDLKQDALGLGVLHPLSDRTRFGCALAPMGHSEGLQLHAGRMTYGDAHVRGRGNPSGFQIKLGHYPAAAFSSLTAALCSKTLLRVRNLNNPVKHESASPSGVGYGLLQKASGLPGPSPPWLSVGCGAAV